MNRRSLWYRKLARLGCLIFCLLLAAILLACLLSPVIRIPDVWSIDARSRDLQLLYKGAERYRTNHQGMNPPTLMVLKEFSEVPSGIYESRMSWKGSADKNKGFFYDPGGVGSDVLITCYLKKPSFRIRVWLTADGRVYVGRYWIWNLAWPKYEEKRTLEELPNLR